jgi:hypothetical protein
LRAGLELQFGQPPGVGDNATVAKLAAQKQAALHESRRFGLALKERHRKVDNVCAVGASEVQGHVTNRQVVFDRN